MGIATRDFIPEGEVTLGEQAKHKRGQIIRTNAKFDDYVPDADSPENQPKPQRTKAERQQAAQDAAAARSAYASQNEYANARTRLKNWTPSQAIDAMQAMAPKVLEMYISAETNTSQREDILSYFPPIDPEVIKAWGELPEVPGPQGTGDQIPVSAPDPLDLAPILEKDNAPQENPEFTCSVCGETKKNAAGLKSHIRAKHTPSDPQAAGDEGPQAEAQE